MHDITKVAVTVAEMARLCSLSRSRFYQLMGTAFPQPSRDERGRPYYSQEQQAACLEVRRRNCGIDGRPILFYAPRPIAPPVTRRQAKRKPRRVNPHAELVDSLHALGLATATATDVDTALQELFPHGTNGVDGGDVIRSVFLFIKRQDRPDNVT